MNLWRDEMTNTEDILISDKSKEEKRKTIILHMNNAMELLTKMDKDKNLRLVYSDLKLNRFIDRCREMLQEDWYEVENIEIPF